MNVRHYMIRISRSQLIALLRGVAPLVAGLLLSGIFVFIAESQYRPWLSNSVFDANTWGIESKIVTKDAKLFAILIAGNFITIFISLVFYGSDINDIFSVSKVVCKKTLCVRLAYHINWITMLVVFFWAIGFALHVIGKGYTDGIVVDDLLRWSSYISFFVFLLFLIEDAALWRAAASIRKVLEDNSLPLTQDSQRDLDMARSWYAMARDSVWFIDVPAIVAAAAIIIYGTISANLHSLGSGFTEVGRQMVANQIDFGLKAVPELQQITSSYQMQTSLGMSAGAHLMQLFISQVIFTILSVKMTLYRGNVS